MSLDELMDLAAEPRSDTATMPIRTPSRTTPPAPGPLNPVAARPAPARPAPAPAPPPRRTTPAPAPTGPDLRERVLADAHRAYEAALERSRQWLKTGDNGLIAATALVALLLIVVVASL